MSGRKSSILALLLICGSIGCVALVASVLNWAQSMEETTVDVRFRVRHALRQKWNRIHVSDQVVLAAVDQDSIDPRYSEFSDRWGVGRWLTRENWTEALRPMAFYYKPSVFALDVLLIPNRSERVSDENAVDRFLKQHNKPLSQIVHEELFPSAEFLNLVDAAGNGNLGNQIYALQDARESGSTGLNLVTAFTLTSKDHDHATPWVSGRDDERIAHLRNREIPPECLEQIPQDVAVADSGVLPFDPLPSGPVHLGFVNVPRDSDGNVRKIPLVMAFRDPKGNGSLIFLPSFSLQSCLLKLGIDLSSLERGRAREDLSIVFGKEIALHRGGKTWRIPIDRYGNMTLNFEGTIHDFRQFSYIDLLKGDSFVSKVEKDPSLASDPEVRRGIQKAEALRDMVSDRIVLAGLTFTGASDIGPCAVDSNTPLVFIHMTAIDNILRQSFLHVMSPMGTAVYILGLMLVMWVLNAFTDPRFSAFAELWLLGATQVAPFLLFFFQISIPMVLPGVSVMWAFGFIYLYRYNTEQKERVAIRKKFSAMVSPRVLRFMEEHPESLSGQRAEATMFFSDVAGFTTISEKLEPEQLSQVLNDYLTPMADLILKRDGYLNKFAGDGIMAVWGVPDRQSDHAVQACLSALEQQAVIDEIRDHFQKKYRVGLKVRMGLNSGTVSVGMMGSKARYEYTVMGDEVNLAARLEPAAKDYGVRILIGKATYDLAKDEVLARPLDKIVVQGKTEPELVYELMKPRWMTKPEDVRLAESFSNAIKLYWERQWTQAHDAFADILKEFPKDAPAFVFLHRVQEFMVHPPPDSWKGEFVRQTKH